MTEKQSPVSTDLDFDRIGFQLGSIRIPYSHDRSAYGHIPIPVAVLKAGEGPTVLLTGGTHGDEYEGPVALMKLLQRMPTLNIQGRLIVIPALNLPAVLNASRTSPIDRGNLNRAFPGKPDGSPTELIAHFVESELLPRADLFIDIHAGGSSLSYLPTLIMMPPADQGRRPLYERLARAFAAPYTIDFDLLGETRTSGAAALRQDALFFTGEFGGCATCSAEGTRIVESGLHRVLGVFGLFESDAAAETSVRESRFLKVEKENYLFADCDGIFEPTFALGDDVKAGALAGRIYDPRAPMKAPTTIFFQADGKIICSRTFATVEAGDCLGHSASVSQQGGTAT